MTDEQPDHLTPIQSDRGFFRLSPVPHTYGGEVSVYESSAASSPHVWLRVTSPSNLNDPSSEPVEGVAHLSLEQAAHVRDQLNWIIENHYQVKGR